TINELESKKIAAQLEQDNQLSIINREYNERELVKTNGQSKYEWTKSQKEVLEDLKNDKSDDGQKLRDQLKEKATNLKKLERTINALNSKFVERGGWNRAFLATSGGDGHVHNSTDCSTCNKGKTPTQFQWMTNYSGSDEKSIVDDAGYRACTVCYPSAPIGDAKSLPTKMLSEEEKEKQIARDERKQKAADKAQKAKDNAPTASGEPRKIGYDTFKTERTAITSYGDSEGDFAIDRAETDDDYRVNSTFLEAQREKTFIILKSLAEKRGVSIQEVQKELEPKFNTKLKKYNKTRNEQSHIEMINNIKHRNINEAVYEPDDFGLSKEKYTTPPQEWND